MSLRTAALLSTLALTACASLSKKECTRGDWAGIGYRDGASGYDEYHVTRHQEACEKHSVIVDLKAYEDGRQRGLVKFCTPAGGLRAGRNGEIYSGVCPAEAEPGFIRGFQLGQELRRVDARIAALRDERNGIYSRLRDLDDARNKRATENPPNPSRETLDENDRRERERMMHRVREIDREALDYESLLRSLELRSLRLDR